MAITNSCVAGREMPRTSKQPILYTYMITHMEIGFIDRPQDIRNPVHTILPIIKMLYFGLHITLFVWNIRVQTKASNQTTTISIRSIVIVVNDAPPFPPIMSKEP